MACLVGGNEIVLTGTVGQMWWDEDHFTHADVVLALARVGQGTRVTVRVNSGGGIASEGAAIHAALSMHKGGVDIVIEGWAASAASLLAMAGQRIVMRPGAILMIHDPIGMVWGSEDDCRAWADALGALGSAYAAVYAAKTGKAVTDMRALMKREVWMGPDEAVAQGFADVVEGPTNDNDAPEPKAFAAIDRYTNTPDRIVALASTHNWRRPLPPVAVASGAPPTHSPYTQETPVSDQAQTGAGTASAPQNPTTNPTATIDPAKIAAEAVAADRKRRADVLACDATQGRESLAEHLLNSTDMAPEAIKAALAAAPQVPRQEQPDAQPDTSDPDAYAASRAAAAGAGLAMPGQKPQARTTLSARGIYTARRKALKEA